MKILYFPLFAKWYDMIASGVKPEEYRDITPHYIQMLLLFKSESGKYVRLKKTEAEIYSANLDMMQQHIDNGILIYRNFALATLTKGYPKKSDNSRRMTFEVLGIAIGKGNAEWGAPTDRQVFIIKLGSRVK